MKTLLTLAFVLFSTVAMAQETIGVGKTILNPEEVESVKKIFENKKQEAVKAQEQFRRDRIQQQFRRFNDNGVRPERPNFGGGQPNMPNLNPGFRPPMFRPPVGYYPVIGWVPQGLNVNFGPVAISPDRRYVRFGINASFYHIPEIHTFNFYTGQSGRIK